MESKEAFEQAIENESPDDYCFDFSPDGYYRDEILDRLWWAWQASRQELEGEAKAIIDRVVADLEVGFVACHRCGDQEDTATLDCMSDLKRLQEVLAHHASAGVPDGYLLVEKGITSESVIVAGSNCLNALKQAQCIEPRAVAAAVFQDMLLAAGEGQPANAGEPDAEYIRALQDACDIIQSDANTKQNYGSLCRIGNVLAKLKAGQEQDQ